MAKVIVAPSGAADVAEIYEYLAAEACFRTADKYRQRFAELYRHLALYPESCPLRPKIASYTRIGIVLPYVVLYRYIEADEMVLVQRVVHGSRRITGKLLGKTKR
jgi:toxin ParE1/3/4